MVPIVSICNDKVLEESKETAEIKDQKPSRLT